ncbi:MAG: polyisoprenoid-binding protein [Pirellulaceae bacterium]|nr:MAG: polyisoprenoid-binding protein [Pirellulaceae bacterium]
MVTKFSVVIGFIAGLLFAGSAWGVEPLKLELDKSKISFVGSKPDGTRHEGGFKKFTVDARADFENPENSSLRIEIDATSLWADDPRLEGHLKNPDFFNVRKYPKIVFESTKIEAPEETKVTITGKLKLLDKTEELVVPAMVETSDSSVILRSNFKLDRFKWGMTYGEGQINKDVDVTVEFHFKR